MERSKVFCVLLLGVFLASVPTASAAFITWTGAALDNDFDNPDNWNGGVMPVANTDGMIFNTDQDNTYRAIIDDSISYSSNKACYIGAFGTASSSAVVDVTGGSWSQNYILMGNSDYASGGTFYGTGVFNMSGGTVTVSGQFIVGGGTGGTSGGGGGVLNMTGGTLNVGAFLIAHYGAVGDYKEGYVHLDGGLITASTNFGFGIGGAVSSERAYMDITEGVFKFLNADKTAWIQNYINGGYITAYDGAGELHLEYDGTDTVLWATIPEPATCILFGLGGFLSLRKRKA